VPQVLRDPLCRVPLRVIGDLRNKGWPDTSPLRAGWLDLASRLIWLARPRSPAFDSSIPSVDNFVRYIGIIVPFTMISFSFRKKILQILKFEFGSILSIFTIFGETGADPFWIPYQYFNPCAERELLWYLRELDVHERTVVTEAASFSLPT
jgi:hypothetical protein